jgi:hypothetical protein
MTSAEKFPTQSGSAFVFGTTRWSVVLAAGHGDAAGAREALEQLCRNYWYPLYAYVVSVAEGQFCAL